MCYSKKNLRSRNLFHEHEKNINFGSSALFDKMLLVKIVENDKIDAVFRAG